MHEQLMRLLNLIFIANFGLLVDCAYLHDDVGIFEEAILCFAELVLVAELSSGCPQPTTLASFCTFDLRTTADTDFL